MIRKTTPSFKNIMTTTISVPQIASGHESCADRQLKLYNAIRERISQSCFSRSQTDEEELLHVIFINLVDKFYPSPDSKEMTKLLDDKITNTIREFKRNVKPALDIDGIEPDEEPGYSAEANAEEEEFEKVFDRFCSSREEPERTIFRRHRTHSRLALADCTGISRNEISRILKTMPRKFEKFVQNFSE